MPNTLSRMPRTPATVRTIVLFLVAAPWAKVCPAQDSDAETGWPALFRIYAQPPAERHQLVLAEGYFLRKTMGPSQNPEYFEYGVDLVVGSNQWQQKIGIRPKERPFMYMTEQTQHWKDLKRQLVDVYGFEEPRDGSAEEQTYVRDSSVVVFRTTPGKDGLTQHYVLIQRIMGDAEAACSPDWSRAAYHALLIGVQQYVSEEYADLKWPLDEVKELERVLSSRYGFECTVLKNPTRAGIMEALELTRGLTCDDHLLIFFAGHGEMDKGSQRGYWLPVDADPLTRARHLSSSDLRDQLRALTAGHVLVISDACYGGAIFKENQEFHPIEGANADTDLEDLVRRRSRRVITSGDLVPVPDQSIFFRALMKALEGNPDKVLETSTLYTGILADIKRARLADPGAKIPLPQYGRLMNSGDLKGELLLRKAK